MVINRIQSVYLLLSAIVMGLYCTVVPLGRVGGVSVYGFDLIPVLVMALLTIVVTLVDIFLFKNLKLQMTVCRVCMWLIVGTLGTFSVIYYRGLDAFALSDMTLSVAAPVVAYILLMLAAKGMRRDHKTLTDYDHFR